MTTSIPLSYAATVYCSNVWNYDCINLISSHSNDSRIQFVDENAKVITSFLNGTTWGITRSTCDIFCSSSQIPLVSPVLIRPIRPC